MTKPTDSRPSEAAPPARLWTVDEANVRVRGLAEFLPQLKAWVVRLRAVHEELHRLSSFWGRELDSADHPDRELKNRLDTEWANLTRRLEESVAALQAEGIEVKDLDAGLVDFYALQEGELVYLCWQRGEPEVAYYHTLEGGYRSRRPLPGRSRAPAAKAGGSA